MKFATAATFSFVLAAVTPSLAAAQAAPAAEWRTVAPENLLIIDTSKGRVVAELEPRMAPQTVARIRTLADQGFYDGLKFHRVIQDFMAQTGDPLGTGQGSSDLPDIPGEFEFRRGRDAGFVQVQSGTEGQVGIMGAMPVITQPDAQMMVTADFKAAAQGLFCRGVVGMARGGDPDSANSQFFLMTGDRDELNGQYAPFGRILTGLDVARALKTGPEAANGRVEDPDVMTRVRTAAALPEGERPSLRVATANSPAFQAEVARIRAERGAAFTICDLNPVVQGG